MAQPKGGNGIMNSWNYDISQAPKGKTETKTKLIKGEVRSWEEHVPERILAYGKKL